LLPLDSLIEHPELRMETMHFVFQIEETTAKSCGTPAGADRAPIRMEKKHEANNS
jgi:hypothetical protein